jgi:hypothetical protein
MGDLFSRGQAARQFAHNLSLKPLTIAFADFPNGIVDRGTFLNTLNFGSVVG